MAHLLTTRAHIIPPPPQFSFVKAEDVSHFKGALIVPV